MVDLKITVGRYEVSITQAIIEPSIIIDAARDRRKIRQAQRTIGEELIRESTMRRTLLTPTIPVLATAFSGASNADPVADFSGHNHRRTAARRRL